MSSTGVSKTCPICFGEIDARATKCPHCHALQGTMRMLQRLSIWIAGIVVILGVLAFIGIVGLAIYEGTGPHRGPNLAGNIEIVSSRQFFLSDRDGKSVRIIGTVRNNGKKALTWIGVQVQCFNADGEVIDLFDDTIPGTIEPSAEIPFKLSPYEAIHSPESEYASHKIIVEAAYEPSRFEVD